MATQRKKLRMYKVHVTYKSVSKALSKAQADALKRAIKAKAKKATVIVKPA